MACNDNIFSDIKATCAEDIVSGIESKAYMISRGDLSFTKDGTTPTKITLLDVAIGKKAWAVTGVKMGLNYRSELVVKPDSPDRYKHTFICKSKQIASADVLAIDKINDIVIVVERKHKAAGTGDGTFVILGLESGLWKTVSTREPNVNDGDRLLEFASMDEALELNSEYLYVNTSYATEKAALEALLITQE